MGHKAEFLTRLRLSRAWGSGLPDRDRTCDPQLRRLLLYPTELRAEKICSMHTQNKHKRPLMGLCCWIQCVQCAGCALNEMVGAAGFELATLCSQSRCATRLRYAPTDGYSNPQMRGYQRRALKKSDQFLAPCAHARSRLAASAMASGVDKSQACMWSRLMSVRASIHCAWLFRQGM